MRHLTRLYIIAIIALTCLSFSSKGQTVTDHQKTHVKLSFTTDWRHLPGNAASVPTFGIGTGIDLVLMDRFLLGAAFDISARHERYYGHYNIPCVEPAAHYWFYYLNGRIGYRIPLDTSVRIDLTPHAGTGLYIEPGENYGESNSMPLSYVGIESDIRILTKTCLKARLQLTAAPDGRIGFNTGCGLAFLF